LETNPKAARILGGLAAGAAGGACAPGAHPAAVDDGLDPRDGRLPDVGRAPRAAAGGRDAGMLVVGVSLGLYFSAPVLREVAAYWPWFVFLGFAAIGYGAASALVLMRLAGVDRATAYFGSMPGAPPRWCR
jgi:hypothetical protein